jgi:hypothetical protein
MKNRTKNELKRLMQEIYCARCCVRIAVSESQVVKSGRVYHSHCFAKEKGLVVRRDS